MLICRGCTRMGGGIPRSLIAETASAMNAGGSDSQHAQIASLGSPGSSTQASWPHQVALAAEREEPSNPLAVA